MAGSLGEQYDDPAASAASEDVEPDGTHDDERGPSESERLVLCQRATAASGTFEDALTWRRAVATRLEVAGGEALGGVGASVVFAFDPLELDDVVELALGLLQDAADEQPQLEVACGLALGEVVRLPEDAGGGSAGAAIDRAWLLAARAETGELVFDAPAQALSEGSLLFRRMLQAGSVSGHVLDARHPYKRQCRELLRALQPPELSERGSQAFDQLRALAAQPGRMHVVLRGPQPHTALDWLQRLADEAHPILVLHLAQRGSGLQPLGALQRALGGSSARLFGAQLEPALREVLEVWLQGGTVRRREAVDALSALMRVASAHGERVWIVLRELRELDSPSLAICTEAVERSGVDPLVWVLADDPSLAPPVLLRGVGHEVVVIDPLSAPERVRVAQSVLGNATDAEIARRVALAGGETSLGIAEAARTLVAAGDLVLEDGAFSWRAQPRATSLPIPVEALLTERLAGLDAPAQRLLEAVCTAPLGAGFELAAEVAALDGLTTDAIERAEHQLRREAWLDGSGQLGALEFAVHNAVRNAMPPARAAELHRFVATALARQLTVLRGPAFGSALLAHHLAEGGREREASIALLDAAQAATEAGFERMALRLAALARKLDASIETASRARGLAHRVETGPPPATNTLASLPVSPHAESAPGHAPIEIEAADPKQMAGSAVRAAIWAIVYGDVESAERALDVALAAGWDTAAAQRLWSIAQLRRGDVPEAVRTLKQANTNASEPGGGMREAIAAGLILLEAGAVIDAVRSVLEALSAARRAQDRRAERAALELLAGCYRALGRAHEAERIDAVLGAV
jgi:hypothetical protein